MKLKDMGKKRIDARQLPTSSNPPLESRHRPIEEPAGAEGSDLSEPGGKFSDESEGRPVGGGYKLKDAAPKMIFADSDKELETGHCRYDINVDLPERAAGKKK